MRRLVPACLALLLAMAPASSRDSTSGSARDSARDLDGGQVAACDSLVALRQLAAEARDDHARALALVTGRPGCRTVAAGALGAVEHRAMVGGAPYECLAAQSGGCLWVLP